MIAGSLQYGFLPTNDVSRSVLSIELPPGSTIADTMATADRITALLKERPEVRSVYAVGGGAGSNGLSVTAGEVRKTTIVVELVPRSNRSHDQKAFQREMRPTLNPIPHLRSTFSDGPAAPHFTHSLSHPLS